MATQIFKFNMDRNNDYISSSVQIGKKNFNFILRWNEYCDCVFLDIKDVDNNDIETGTALVNGLTIRKVDIPTQLFFTHLDGKTYEPTIDNFDEFGFVCEIEE